MKILTCLSVICLMVNTTTQAQNTPWATTGNIGIGTTDPQAKLHVKNGSILATDNDANNINVRLNGQFEPSVKFSRWTGNGSQTHNGYIGMFHNPVLQQYNLGIGIGESLSGDQNAASQAITITLGGNVGIGTTSPGNCKLAVNGKIGCREVHVLTGNFPDYVFDLNYKLRSLQSLEKYIADNKHLPGIPSAIEVEKDGGVNLGALNVKLLEKIEELTLYIIDLNKKIEKLEGQNKVQKNRKPTL